MKLTETFTSSMHVHVRFYVYQPKVILRIKGVVQIHHGMGEHADCYDHFATFLLNQGFVVVVSDFVGHGQSLIDFEQGYFGNHNGPENLIKDMYRLYAIIRSRYPDVPYFLLGEGLGSVLIRKFITEYGDCIDGAILLGTPTKVNHQYIKSSYLYIMKSLKGPIYKGNRFFKGLYQFYNKKINQSGSGADWITSDLQEREKYLEDPMTHFAYTIQGYRDIVHMITEVNKDDLIMKTPQHLSLYIGVGEFDPVSQGIEKIVEKYKNNHVQDITFYVFEKRRHALLFEQNKKEIYLDILNWLNDRTYL